MDIPKGLTIMYDLYYVRQAIKQLANKKGPAGAGPFLLRH